MNAKTANLIAVELGILIAIMAWLAFSNLSIVKHHTAAGGEERTAGSFATVMPGMHAGNQRVHVADYRAEPEDQQGGEQQAPTDRGLIRRSPRSLPPIPILTTASSPGVHHTTLERTRTAGIFTDYLASPSIHRGYAQPTEIIFFNARSFGRRQTSARFGGGRMMMEIDAIPQQPADFRRVVAALSRVEVRILAALDQARE
jgi:hypothetical protein